MFNDFLKFDTTFATRLKDFKSWHKGIEHFGFWAIEVSTPSCLDEIKKHQEHLKYKLHADYSRQAHITLQASGLLCEDFFSKEQIKNQVLELKKNNIKCFPLILSTCNSFSTCPYLIVKDSFSNLTTIRQTLNSISNENKLSVYTPHITLGFYNNEYNTSDIVKNISSINSLEVEFMVNEIVFAQYKTKEIQGPYEVLHRIKLGA